MRPVYYFLFGLLLLRVGWYYAASALKPAPVTGTTVRLVGTLSSQPRMQGILQYFKIGDYRIYTPSKPALYFGDKIEITGKANEAGAIYYPQVKTLQLSASGFWWKMAAQIRSEVIKTYQRVLPKTEADLLSGIVLGGGTLDRNFKEKLAAVGLTHVVAASGMNVSFFSAAVFGLLSVLGGGRIVKILVGVAFILFYITMTGFEPPIVRAGLMAALMYITTLIGRVPNASTGLTISAFVMLWVSPNLLTNPSFLLSFAAMASQIFAGTITIALPNFLEAIIKLVIQSVCALAFTFPIVLIFFSSFSLISLFTNLLVLWMIEPLMILGTLIASFGAFFTPISRAFSVPAQGLLDFFLWVVNTFGQPSLASRLQLYKTFSNNLNAILFAAIYYLLLFLAVKLVLSLTRNKKRNLSQQNYS